MTTEPFYRYKFFFSFLLILTLILLASCGGDKVAKPVPKIKIEPIIKKTLSKKELFQKKLIGKWSGINNHGRKVFFHFKKNNKVVMFQGYKLIGDPSDHRIVTWDVDPDKNPNHLDIVINNEGRVTRFRMIVRFFSYNKIQIRMGKNLSTRPTKFSNLGTSWLQVDLNRQY